MSLCRNRRLKLYSTKFPRCLLAKKAPLRALLDEQLKNPDVTISRMTLVKPIPVPDQGPGMRWLNEHSHEYGGQWAALDGARLIAHGAQPDEVFASADADGAYLPLVTYIPLAGAAPFVGV